uniref:Uncharacterized protein n=1 Tax=Arundo donax TaxID=35708 RepID=A0A0A9BY51_ARUDO
MLEFQLDKGIKVGWIQSSYRSDKDDLIAGYNIFLIPGYKFFIELNNNYHQ